MFRLCISTLYKKLFYTMKVCVFWRFSVLCRAHFPVILCKIPVHSVFRFAFWLPFVYFYKFFMYIYSIL